MTAAHYAGLSRIPLTLIAAYFILEVPTGGRFIAAWVVLLAGITDLLDGVFARRQRTVSAFGAVLDFTTDKIFVLPTLFLAVGSSGAGLWMAVLITIREVLIMGVRTFAAGAGATLAVDRLGKLKSLLLYPAVGVMLLDLPGAGVLLGFATAATLLSGATYLVRAWPLIEGPLLRPRAASGAAEANADVTSPTC
jgi:CDP-diacylglycerol---glycerol-3-phosphate 3-phosphatidyltransferase